MSSTSTAGSERPSTRSGSSIRSSSSQLSGRGVAEPSDQRRARAGGAAAGDLAGVVARVALLLVGGVVLLVDDDQARRPAIGREDRRARPDADARLAVAQPMPLVAALAGAEPRVQDRDPVAEAGDEARHRLRRHRDLRHEDDHPAAALERRLGGGEVDLGLARAGDPVQEQLAVRPPSRPATIRSTARALGGVELDRPAAAAPIAAPAGRRRTWRSAELDQAAALEPQQRVAADAGRGELAGAEPFGARPPAARARAAGPARSPPGSAARAAAVARAVVSVRAAV